MAQSTANLNTTPTVQPQVDSTPSGEKYTWRTMMGNALIITRREVVESFFDWRIIAPIIVLTFVFPFLATILAERFIAWLLTYNTDFVLIGERSIPFLLMIVGFFPISISLVIALETFVGEKERRSLEPLLSTPLTNTELYVGKTLAAMIPPLVASYGGMSVYLLPLLFGELAWRPQPMLIVQIFVLTTVQALVMVTGAVVVSSQATSTRAANLLASFVIIPMSLIIQAEAFIMFIAPDAESPYGLFSIWLIILGMSCVTVLFLRVGNSIFNREELLGRTVDEFNIRNILRRMGQSFISVDDKLTPARNLIHWYQQGVGGALRHLGAAFWITVIWVILMTAGGYIAGQLPRYQFPLSIDPAALTPNESVGVSLDTFAAIRNPQWIWWNNTVVVLIGLVSAIFTFGAASLLFIPFVMVLLGYLYSQLQLAGFDMTLFWAAVLPHGIVEIPLLILATAAAFRFGTVITKPPVGKTVGMSWMLGLGNVLKIFVGIIIPGLFIAALLEAYVTPQVVIALLGGG